MKERVSGYIIKDNQILLINRFRTEVGQYHVIPGGKVDGEESLEEALKRELKEETNLDVEVGKKLHTFTRKHGKSKQRHVFEILSFTGEPKMIGEETKQNSPENSYKLEWIPLDQVEKINLQPPQHKQYLSEIYL